jgi:hypothetical protein
MALKKSRPRKLKPTLMPGKRSRAHLRQRKNMTRMRKSVAQARVRAGGAEREDHHAGEAQPGVLLLL